MAPRPVTGRAPTRRTTLALLAALPAALPSALSFALSTCSHPGDKAALAGARRLGDFAAYRLLQGLPDGGARLPEWYDEAWKPLATHAEGGYIDFGHQFEWSHLFTEGAAVSPVYAQVAERVLAYVLAAGYDALDGGCGQLAFPDAGKADMYKGWWQQAECLPCRSGGCKDEQPDPYHMARLHHAALRLSGALGPAAP
jgi:mannose-6-phosphate isomerase